MNLITQCCWQNPKSENDVKNKGLLIATKVCGSIICTGCIKPQVIYANTSLKYNKKVAIQHVEDSRAYQRNERLFSSEDILNTAV